MSVGEAILGAFVQVILQNLYTLIQSKISEVDQLGTDLEHLKTSLESIRDILGDVERRKVRREALQARLVHLRDAAYDANDVLDEISTEELRREAVHFAEVRKTFSDMSLRRQHFKHKIGGRIRQIIEKIDRICKNNSLHPTEAGGSSSRTDGYQDIPTTGILSRETRVFGRRAEIANLVELLTTDEYSTHHISVIPIQGVGGLGKTALAQVVFNHEVVSPHFDLKMWVHVSHDSDVTNLTKLIHESVAGPTGVRPLNSLQVELISQLSGKKYLLVLDNMWNERSEDCNRISEDWSELQKPLLHGARGSKILITTRNPTTAKNTSTIGRPRLLRGLPYDDCWEVFKHHAFEDLSECRSLPDLVVRGMTIVKKCCGSPLAARTLGRHLRHADPGTWESVENGDILHLEQSRDGILRALESTYHQLPPHLKQCFRFCGTFPKDFKFGGDVLVRLWMALGFIPPNGNGESMERIGARYLNSLVERLFFKQADDDPYRYVMSDLISELAQYVSQDECYIVEHNKQLHREMSETIRHSSLVCSHKNSETIFPRSSSSNQLPAGALELFYKTKGLYALLVIGDSRCCSMQIPEKMAKEMKRLRVLNLGNVDIERLDDSIDELIHLRYLSISSTRIRSLPESLCTLYNLQTLGLRNCTSLERLPKDIKYLKKLRHLDLHLDGAFWVETVSMLRSMPKEIGNLINLQTLSRFAVGESSRFVLGEHRSCAGIKELGNLNGIHGDLRLLRLHNVHDPHEAMEAKLSSKEHITKLELQWGDNRSSTQHDVVEELVLDGLKPHANLTELWIVGYNGASFPPWIGHHSFSSLVMVRLSNCRTCKKLPPLGQLPFLEDLCIKGMDGVDCLDCGFCGESNRFRLLRTLCFESMRNLELWCGEQTCTLPSLRRLVIKDCPLLGNSLYHPFPPTTEVIRH